jgi:hypothetical protein
MESDGLYQEKHRFHAAVIACTRTTKHDPNSTTPSNRGKINMSVHLHQGRQEKDAMKNMIVSKK